MSRAQAPEMITLQRCNHVGPLVSGSRHCQSLVCDWTRYIRNLNQMLSCICFNVKHIAHDRLLI